MPNGASTAHRFKPKLATILKEGYGLKSASADMLAGLTVAIVALPLSMAIAVASGVSPQTGLHTAIVGGFLVSALAGSRFQVGGPAGAFIVLVAATVAQFGLGGLALTVAMSGLMLTLLGILRLGFLIRLIPHPVTIGFTAAIAVTILASQLRDLGGLSLSGPEPGAFFPKIAALAQAAPSWTPAAVGLGGAVVATIFGLRRISPIVPGMLIALLGASVAAWAFAIPVETIGSRFGGISRALPTPHLPPLDLDLALAVLPSALAFALLGGVESLLSARVADQMTSRVHRSNMELVAQGLANIGSAVFGGIAVTGTIARTAANIRAGAKTPVAGMLHALILLVFVVVAAPLMAYVPLAALAGVLVVVAWGMVEAKEAGRLLRDVRAAAMLLATFGGTLLHDLTVGILAGCALAVLFLGVERIRRT